MLLDCEDGDEGVDFGKGELLGGATVTAFTTDLMADRARVVRNALY